MRYWLLLALFPGIAQAETCNVHNSRHPDPSYEQLAEHTGGKVIMRDRKDVGNPDATRMMMKELQDRNQTLANILYLADVAPTQPIAIPIDGTLHEITFDVNVVGDFSVSVTDPESNEVKRDAKGQEVLKVSSDCMANVTAPEPGIWHLALKGKGTAMVRVFGRSQVHLDVVEFEKWVMGREGPMTTSILPTLSNTQNREELKDYAERYRALAGKVVSLEIAADTRGEEGVSLERFEIRTVKGKLLATLPMKHCKTDPLSYMPSAQENTACVFASDTNYFVPKIRLPEEASYIYVLGKDKDGHALMRERTFFGGK